MKTLKDIEDRYCSGCGTKMIKSLKRADKVTVTYGPFCDDMTFAHRYNTITGKEQFVPWFQCPFYHKFIFDNGHDAEFEREIIYE